MIRHIVFWDHGDNFTAEEKAEHKRQIKEGLEGLKGVIPGLREIKVYTDMLAHSNVDLVLDSTFESIEALEGYQAHPAHVKVASEIVRPRIKNRRCADFEIG